jgi:hypothetical protein
MDGAPRLCKLQVAPNKRSRCKCNDTHLAARPITLCLAQGVWVIGDTRERRLAPHYLWFRCTSAYDTGHSSRDSCEVFSIMDHGVTPSALARAEHPSTALDPLRWSALPHQPKPASSRRFRFREQVPCDHSAYHGSTVRTTLPVFCPVSTYRVASTTCSNG